MKIFNDRRGKEKKKRKLGDIGATSSVIDVFVIYGQQDARETMKTKQTGCSELLKTLKFRAMKRDLIRVNRSHVTLVSTFAYV